MKKLIILLLLFIPWFAFAGTNQLAPDGWVQDTFIVPVAEDLNASVSERYAVPISDVLSLTDPAAIGAELAGTAATEVAAGIATHEGAADPHPVYLLDADVPSIDHQSITNVGTVTHAEIDAQIPTTDEKAALAGVSTPDVSNPYATRTDVIYQVDDYTALRALTGQTLDKQASVAYRSTAGDGGGGVFRWDSSDLSTSVTDDTLSGVYVAPDSDATGASGAWVRVRSNEVRVAWFGAFGVDADNYLAIQASLDFLSAHGGVYVVDGMYGTASPLTVARGAFYFIIKGVGGKGFSGFKALAPMDYILTIGDATVQYQGDFDVSLLTLNCNNLSGGVDFANTRYSNFERNKINSIASGKVGIRIGSWVNRVKNNNVDGAGSGLVICGNTAIPSNSVNNLLVLQNNFSSLEYGVRNETYQVINNGTVIRGNTFDAISKAAMFINGHARGLTFSENYIEACGGVAVSVEISDGIFEDRYGAIVLSKRYSNVEGYSGLRIVKNTFNSISQSAPVGQRTIISTENIFDGVIENNNIYPSGATYDSFVSIDGIGQPNTAVTRFHISHADPPENFPRLVAKNLRVGINEREYGNFSAQHIKGLSFVLRPTVDIFSNLTEWVGGLTVTHGYGGGVPKINMVMATTESKVLTITTEEVLASLRNKYLRIKGIVKPITTSPNGLRVIVAVDTGSGYVNLFDSAREGTESVRVTDGHIAYIPTDAVGVQFTLRPVYAGEIDVYGLELIDTGLR